ncbi:MAG: MFS transporter [Proteobacteria bacterium]|nr:MFS transporter [Pseudomonadota bacterium]
MLAALTTGFAMSQAYRTVAALMAPALQADFGASPQSLGLFAGAFHFAFGALQMFVGIGIDLHGIRRTVLAMFPLAIAGSAMAALAPHFAWLVVAQALIGVGCAPAFLVCTVFIARSYPPQRFAALSGLVLGVGGIGMLATGTPLAWLIAATSWRAGFGVLGACAVASWVAIWWCVTEPPRDAPSERESLGQAMRRFAQLFALPHTAGIVALGFVGYAAFIALRGLWLGPLLIARYRWSLVDVGNVALVVSIVSMLGPPLFGRLDPGPARRRRWLVIGTVAMAGLLVAMAAGLGAVADVGLSIVFGLLSGVLVLQYADVRAAYPASITGRALALFTMAMFLGVAAMQWFTGWVAERAPAYGVAPFVATLATMAALLAIGALAYVVLPAPRRA